jgi:hypothetical protein
MDDIFRVSSWMATRAQAGAVKEIDEAEGLPDTAQGDVEGAEIQGGIEEVVQTAIQEGQFFQEGVMVGLVRPALLEVKVAGEMLGVAAEG